MAAKGVRTIGVANPVAHRAPASKARPSLKPTPGASASRRAGVVARNAVKAGAPSRGRRKPGNNKGKGRRAKRLQRQSPTVRPNSLSNLSSPGRASMAKVADGAGAVGVIVMTKEKARRRPVRRLRPCPNQRAATSPLSAQPQRWL
jgi:hypothetical protein